MTVPFTDGRGERFLIEVEVCRADGHQLRVRPVFVDDKLGFPLMIDRDSIDRLRVCVPTGLYREPHD